MCDLNASCRLEAAVYKEISRAKTLYQPQEIKAAIRRASGLVDIRYAEMIKYGAREEEIDWDDETPFGP